MPHALKGDDTNSIAESLAPYYTDDTQKTRYLSYRGSGFTVREAAELVGIHQRTVANWRHEDPEFSKYDREGLSEFRAKFGAMFVMAEFNRNFRLTLQNDYRVLNKSVRLGMDKLTERELSYMNNIRKHYTPEALDKVRAVLSGKSTDPQTAQFNFSQIVLQMGRERGQAPTLVVDQDDLEDTGG